MWESAVVVMQFLCVGVLAWGSLLVVLHIVLRKPAGHEPEGHERFTYRNSNDFEINYRGYLKKMAE